MPSEFEIAEEQRQNEARQFIERKGAISAIGNQVETVIGLHEQAGILETKIADFDANKGGMQERVQKDRADWLLLWVFCITVIAYVILEFMTSGDIAEVLGYQMTPHFGIDPATGGTPIWLRRAAGVGFVAAMLIATLLMKLLTTWFAARLKDALAKLKAWQIRRYWMLTSALWSVQLVKIIYVIGVGILYIWLYGFATERAAMMAEISKESKQPVGYTGSGMKMVGGVLESDKDHFQEEKTSKVAEAKSTISRLAGAVGVYYTMIVMLHALVLCIPTQGFARELEYAQFRRGKAETMAANMRSDEKRILRSILQDIRIAPPQYRDDLVRASESVHEKINSMYGYPVIGIAGLGKNPPTEGPDGEPAQSSDAPLPPHGSNGNHTIPTDQNVRGSYPVFTNGMNGQHPQEEEAAPTADWNAIFPPRQT